MKRIYLLLAVLSVPCLLVVGDLLARGGGGGGGMRAGGGAGGYRGGAASMAGRTPAMSAPRPSAPIASRPGASRPSISQPSISPPRVSQPIAGTRPGAATRPGAGTLPSTGARPGIGVAQRPTQGQLENFLDIRPGGGGQVSTLPASPPGGNLAGAVAGGVAGGAAAEFLRDSGARPSTLPATVQRPGAGERPGIAERPGAGQRPLAQNRPDRIENRQEWQQNRVQRRDEIRDQVRENYPRLDFWSNYPNWAAWRINRPYRWATWAALTGWIGGYGWTEPYTYAYGENVYFADDSVYYGDQVVASADQYCQQAEAIAAAAPEIAPDKTDWMPLGVFALTPDGQASGPDPTLFLQLAVSKEGIISGTFYNAATNTTQPIEGMADKKTQRVAWTVVGKSRPIMETGISNLTQDTSPALVHFADGQTQQWLMVRLAEPAAK
jgi:hypothetical protein